MLITAFAVSALYELFRSTAKADTSRYDSTRWVLNQGTPFYAIGFGLAVLVRTGWPWVTWTGLLVAVALIGVSILYYSPIVLPQRQPGPLDWLCLQLRAARPRTGSARPNTHPLTQPR